MKEEKGNKMIYERPCLVVLEDSEGLVAEGQLDCQVGSGASGQCKPGASATAKCAPGAGN